MPKEITLANAKLITPDGVQRGHLVMADGLIKNLGNGVFPKDHEDMDGDYLLPGLVELHTDNLEKHLMPRPEVYWPEPGAALEAHDAQIAAAGITTVFDSLCVGEPVDKGRRVMLELSIRAMKEAAGLRADHKTHLRCEVGDPEMWDMFRQAAEMTNLGLVSLMDHTPGQRQWRDPAAYKAYHQKKCSDAEFGQMARLLAEQRDRFAPAQTEKVASFCRAKKLPLASHDDTLPAHIEEAKKCGVSISEFPTTLEAAKAAAEAGLAVAMGAPNLVRGGSHSGNVSALEVAQSGYLDCLSSDYVPASLLYGAWLLHQKAEWDIARAIKTAAENPARHSGLTDRGKLEPGLRADVVRAGVINNRPVIKSVWAAGRLVF
ncbi:MAG: alpha-D-ribose 1-methylphosphonate 5-triphosphate diphosphatase [Deltaproteobacteria bacterium]|jgi:alpha-D-ribose 1-methylphosphonate 5-triphosphate diphosphatase|nr:alpha-D-ribose 1-methylphosphonate 5-triphosphate diphosphatase [Deltaproteobacteria bacterium]